MSGDLDAARIVGLLADEARRSVVAAMILGAVTLSEIRTTSGLDARSAVDALARLRSAGLVVGGNDANVLLESSFAEAARSAAPSLDAPLSTSERIVRTFVVDGRLTSLPTQRSKRLVVLDLISQDFEPGLKYNEPEVNAIVGRWHDDHAALRRSLVDEAYLDREAGSYWRSGGSVDTIDED